MNFCERQASRHTPCAIVFPKLRFLEAADCTGTVPTTCNSHSRFAADSGCFFRPFSVGTGMARPTLSSSDSRRPTTPDKPAGTSRRPLGTLSLACLVVANMIGAGVYTTSGFSLVELHRPVVVIACWAIAGGIALLGAVCYGALASRLAESGGEYLFLSRAVHPAVGFMAGWISLTAGFSGAIAFAAKTFAYYLPAGLMAQTFSPSIWAIGLVILLTAVNLTELKFAANAQNVIVLLKMLALTGLILYGFSVMSSRWAATPEVLPIEANDAVSESSVLPESEHTAGSGTWSWGALASSLMWISFSYAGYNAAIYVAGVARQGKRTVPRAMWVATLLVTILYLGLNTVFLYAPPLEQIVGEKEVALIAARSLGGIGLVESVRAVVLISLATSVLAMIQVGPHVYAQMAHDRLLPRCLDTSHPTPRLGVLLQAALAIFLILFTDLLKLLDYLTFLLSISSAATVACLFLPSFRGSPHHRPVPLWPWLPLLFTGVTLGIAILALRYRLQTDPQGLVLALAVLPIGGLIYAIARWLDRPGREGCPPRSTAD